MVRKIDPEQVEDEVAALGDLDLSALRERWQQLYGSPPPKSLRKAFLAKAVAYGIQVKAFGGLKPATKRRLREIAEAAWNGTMDAVVSAPRLKPGVRLVRAWKGATHVVTVLGNGRFEWNGTRHRSLSAIARAITGISWNGYTFFGLKKVPADRGAPEADNLMEEPMAPPLAADDDTEVPLISSANSDPERPAEPDSQSGEPADA